MINYKRLIGAGVIGLLLSTTPNLYAQNVETKFQSSGNEKLESTAEKKARELKALGKEREIAELTANQNNLRYMVHLATTENGMKKPEVFEDLFKKLGVSYFKQQGTREQRYDFYARQFEDFVIEPYGELTSNEILSINEVLMDYFSSADRKEFLNHLGFNGNFGP